MAQPIIGEAKTEATQIFTALPFGLNAMEMNGWLYYGGGLELYRELYDTFNLRPFSMWKLRLSNGRLVLKKKSIRLLTLKD